MRGKTVGRTLSKPGIAGARMGKSVVFKQGIRVFISINLYDKNMTQLQRPGRNARSFFFIKNVLRKNNVTK